MNANATATVHQTGSTSGKNARKITEFDREVDMSRNRVDFSTDERGLH